MSCDDQYEGTRVLLLTVTGHSAHFHLLTMCTRDRQVKTFSTHTMQIHIYSCLYIHLLCNHVTREIRAVSSVTWCKRSVIKCRNWNFGKKTSSTGTPEYKTKLVLPETRAMIHVQLPSIWCSSKFYTTVVLYFFYTEYTVLKVCPFSY